MRTLKGVAAVGLLAAAALVGAAPAEATTYRYWIYWNGDSGSWKYSQIGAGGRILQDQSVDGWRFGRSAASSSATTPRRDPSYSALCGAQSPVANERHVAVVIDWGTESDSPGYATKTYCLTLPDSNNQATGAKALIAAVGGGNIRTDGSGLVCAIKNYPKPPECGKTVASTPSSPRPSHTATTPPASHPSTGSTRGGNPGTTSGSGQQGSSTPAQSTTGPSAAVGQTAQPTLSHGPASAPSASESPQAEPSDATAEPPSDSNDSKPAGDFPLGLVAGIGLLAVVGGGALIRARRQ